MAEGRQALGQWTLAGVAGFAGLLLGLLTPVVLFGTRLALLEQQTLSALRTLDEVQREVKATNASLNDLRLELTKRSGDESP